MKKYIYMVLTAAFIAVLISCNKKDNTTLFDENPNEREQRALTGLQNSLLSPDGWIADVYTKSATGKAYSFYFVFDNNNRVRMLADIDSVTANKLSEGSYSLKMFQQPTLRFDSYNYIHRLADPMPDASGGNGGVGNVAAQGLISDYQFGMTGTTIDSLINHDSQLTHLFTVGRYNEIPVTFRKASKAEGDFWKGGSIFQLRKNVINFDNQGYLYLDLSDGTKVSVDLDYTNKTALFSWFNANNVTYSARSSYTFQPNMLKFKDSIIINNLGFVNLYWDANKLVYFLGSTKYDIKVSSTPIFPLHFLFGTVGNRNFAAPFATTYPGWSADFQARRAQAAQSLLTGGYNLRLEKIYFRPNSTTGKMPIVFDIRQNSTLFSATFNLKYTKTAEGILKFEKDTDPTYLGSNAAITEAGLAPLLAQRILTDNFAIEYYSDPVQGLLAMFKSIEHPDFTFTCRFE